MLNSRKRIVLTPVVNTILPSFQTLVCGIDDASYNSNYLTSHRYNPFAVGTNYTCSSTPGDNYRPPMNLFLKEESQVISQMEHFFSGESNVKKCLDQLHRNLAGDHVGYSIPQPGTASGLLTPGESFEEFISAIPTDVLDGLSDSLTGLAQSLQTVKKLKECYAFRSRIPSRVYASIPSATHIPALIPAPQPQTPMRHKEEPCEAADIKSPLCLNLELQSTVPRSHSDPSDYITRDSSSESRPPNPPSSPIQRRKSDSPIRKTLKKRRIEGKKSRQFACCSNCKKADTPEWRKGPNGNRSLCNACGLFYSKLFKRYGAGTAAKIFHYRRFSGQVANRTVPSVEEKDSILKKTKLSKEFEEFLSVCD